VLKMLIVDDERTTRHTLVNHIPWRELGIGEVEQADDGIRALELAKRQSPDIVMTDIRMPRLDGLSFARELRTCLPRSKVIILSAYSEVDYLKSAIKLNVVDYVEKPIDLDEVKRVLASAAAACAEENRRRRKETEALRRELADRLCEPCSDFAPLRAALEECAPDLLRGGRFLTISAAWDGRPAEGSPAPAHADLERELETVLNGCGFSALLATRSPYRSVVHLAVPDSVTASNLLKSAIEAWSAPSEAARPALFLAAGTIEESPENLYRSHGGAMQAADRLFLSGFGGRAVFGDEAPSAPFAIDMLPAEEFSAKLRESDPEGIALYLKQLEERLRSASGVSSAKLRRLYHSLLLAAAEKLGHPNGEDEASSLWDRLQALPTLAETSSFALRYVSGLFASQSGHKPEGGTVVGKAKRFIEQRACDPNLSISALADHLYLTPSYVCLIFKQETGVTINQYLTSIRIAKAKALIADPSIKLHRVSGMVGYTDGKYFARLFKKECGLTPSDFRRAINP